jgi:hypothetical protein
MIRAKAIFYALKYGLLPWWLYEDRCHHAGMGYFGHVWINLKQAGRWATWSETRDDVRFEAINQALPLLADLRWPLKRGVSAPE